MSGAAPNSTTAEPEPEATSTAPAVVKHWEGHPEGPFAGVVAWATGEFARLEAMITKDAPKVEATIAAVETDIADKLAPSSTTITQPSMPSPNMGGTKE
jgi:hypothetical protein